MIRNKNEVNLIVKSSYSCIDENTELTFHFSGLSEKDNLKIKSWNKFNCDGDSYYQLTKEQLNYLKGKKVQFIHMYYKESLICYIDNNQSDYFDQLASLIK